MEQLFTNLSHAVEGAPLLALGAAVDMRAQLSNAEADFVVKQQIEFVGLQMTL